MTSDTSKAGVILGVLLALGMSAAALSLAFRRIRSARGGEGPSQYCPRPGIEPPKPA
jgi:hypothetical protein